MGNTTSSSVSFASGMSAVRAGAVPLDDHQTWALIFAADPTLGEISGLATSRSLRQLRRTAPANLAVVVYKCVLVLKDFTTLAEGAACKVGDVPMARTALRLLSVLVPTVLEPHGAAPAEDGEAAEHPLAKDFAYHLLTEGRRFDRAETFFPPLEEGATLGETLVDVVVACASTAGFCIGTRQVKAYASTEHPGIDGGRLWGVAVGNVIEAPLHTDAQTHRNRLALMRCLVSLMAGQTYTPTVLVRDPVRARLLSADTPKIANLVASLLATVSQYVAAGIAPYSSHWVGEQEECVHRAAEVLVLALDAGDFHPRADAIATRVLNTAAERDEQQQQPQRAAGSSLAREDADAEDGTADATGPASVPNTEANVVTEGSASDNDDDTREEDTDGAAAVSSPASAAAPAGPFKPDVSKHSFWSVVQSMTGREAQSVLNGIVRLMDNYVAASNTYLPGSQRQLPGHTFYFALFWLLVEKAPNMALVVASNAALARRVLVALLGFGMQGTFVESKHPSLQMCMSVLSTLSTHRKFATALNHPFDQWVPFKIESFTGSFADFLIISLHSVALKRHAWVIGVHHMVFAVLNNVAPYVTSMCSVTAVKLVNLLQFMSSEAYLRERPLHPRLLPKLVVALASLVQYQPVGSTSLIYALVRNRAAVRFLVDVAHQADLGLPKDYYRDPHVFTLHCTAKAADEELTSMLRDEPSADVIELLKRVTLVGKVPVPHALRVLTFAPSPASDAWRTSWLWSLVFTHNFPHIVDPVCVRIFNVASRAAEQQQREQQAAAAAANGAAPRS